MTAQQPVTLDQLARLYADRNEANRRMALAVRHKTGVVEAKAEAGRLNRAYAEALRAYKRAQKAANRRAARERMFEECAELIGERGAA